jgi:hypothetical protein
MGIIEGVVTAVIAAAVVYMLGIGGSKTVVTVAGHRVSKTWKLLIVLGWGAFIGAGFYCISWASVSGFNDPKVGLSFSLSLLGLVVLLLGKFGDWWNR